MIRVMALAAGLLSLSACMAIRYENPEVYSAADGYQTKQWVNSVLYGLIPLDKVKMNVCPEGEVIKEIRSQQNFLNLLAYSFTSGIWSPQTVKITCAKKGG
ncbi:MAG: Bor/Iss family lipoprotein [Myxococcota bacterium]